MPEDSSGTAGGKAGELTRARPSAVSRASGPHHRVRSTAVGMWRDQLGGTESEGRGGAMVTHTGRPGDQGARGRSRENGHKTDIRVRAVGRADTGFVTGVQGH